MAQRQSADGVTLKPGQTFQQLLGQRKCSDVHRTWAIDLSSITKTTSSLPTWLPMTHQSSCQWPALQRWLSMPAKLRFQLWRSVVADDSDQVEANTVLPANYNTKHLLAKMKLQTIPKFPGFDKTIPLFLILLRAEKVKIFRLFCFYHLAHWDRWLLFSFHSIPSIPFHSIPFNSIQFHQDSHENLSTWLAPCRANGCAQDSTSSPTASPPAGGGAECFGLSCVLSFHHNRPFLRQSHHLIVMIMLLQTGQSDQHLHGLPTLPTGWMVMIGQPSVACGIFLYRRCHHHHVWVQWADVATERTECQIWSVRSVHASAVSGLVCRAGMFARLLPEYIEGGLTRRTKQRRRSDAITR